MNSKTKYSEEELVALLQERNEQAFSYLYDNYSGSLYGIVNSIVPNKETANDVLQNVFINIWRKIESYDSSKGRLFTWMLNIARNAAIDEVRSKGYNDSQKNQSLNENVDIPGAVTGPTVGDVGLKKVLMNLKEEMRVLVDMSYFQGFTHEEISKALNIPLGTVKTRIRSALIQLRTLIQ
ncbi:MAG TPA: sigma-70 family RNA polymerase sigma factor [Chitinophagaceae bacterium]|nr:sigma-70 family RNA polymerase sigma factor [Chitinophagaceae bacterium]